MDAQDLARWTRFATKGGIGKCTALRDCIAQNPEDLMFLQGDEIIVLMQVSSSDSLYLGFCEDVVGKFSGSDVKFHGKLKKPIITRRPGSVTSHATVSPNLTGRPVLPSPTPSDPSTSPFHLDRIDTDPDNTTIEQGPSELSHNNYSRGPSSLGHARSSRPNTGQSSLAERSPGSDSPSVDTPARRSEEQQQALLAIEVVDEQGLLSHPLPSPTVLVGDKNTKGPAPLDASLVPSRRQEVVSAIYAPSTIDSIQPLPSKKEDIGVIPKEERTSSDVASPTEMLPRDNDPSSFNQADEPYSPSSEYTKEGALTSEDSHIQRSSTMTVSDGGFGIGLSLLQGLANADRASSAWSESEADESSNIRQPTQVTSPVAAGRKFSVASGVSNLSSADDGQKTRSARSESENGDGGYGWDDDDFLDDYRYSRYSLGSKASKQSRTSTVPSLARSSKMPPIPDEARPSLDGRSSTRSASTSSPPPMISPGLLNPRPLNIVKNTFKTAVSSPTPSISVPSEESRSTPIGIASAIRQRLEDEQGRESPSKATSEELTPRPSADNHNYQSSTSDPPPEYEDNNSEPESSQEVEMPPNPFHDALSPTSTTGSTNSIFLPHPGAPKPVMNNAGQITPRPAAIHVATAAASVSSGSISPTSPDENRSTFNNNNGNDKDTQVMSFPAIVSLLSTLRMAQAKAREVKSTTLYGTTQMDLLSSPGPVPIAFSLEGHPPPSPHLDPGLGFPRQRAPSPASPIGLGITPPNGQEANPSGQQPIHRPNFFPKRGTPRPRSRSFSGFSMSDSEVLIPVDRSQEEGSKPRGDIELSGYRSNLRGTSPVMGQSHSANPSPQIRSRSPSSRGPARAQRPTHVPSPLSLPAINRPESKVMTQLGGSTGPPSPNVNPDGSKPHKHGLRQVASSGLLRLGGGGNHTEGITHRQEIPTTRTSNDKRENSPTKLTRRSISHGTSQPDEAERDRSELTTPSLIQGGSSSSSSPMVRSASLRSKLSVTALRVKGSTGRPSRDGMEGHIPSSSPLSAGTSRDEEDRVQVKDMEFELVKPMLKTTGLRRSEDNYSAQVASPESESIRSGLEGSTPWRTESPAFSPAMSHARSPDVRSLSVDSLANLRGASAIQVASIEAHRMREQKWMSLISSNPSSQARKSKKVKRLILEGVPSSVRGRVWGHITDSQARRMEGLFMQLVKKAPKQIVPVVQQDVERCFPDHPHLRDPQGSLASLLLAYVAMVPDIRYRTGLTRIGGHLLLQAPDEDAFWIFVAVMDSHLRGYYHSSNTGQFEIDSSLFQSILESVEPELARFLFNDCGIRSIDVCGSWFTCLFAGILPPDHLYRMWDVLFYEGPIYLFRVALALITLCKRPLMALIPSHARREAALELLNRPPMSAIPQDPESFISHTFTVKIRDDDLRKQRMKREAQWKKDRLAQR